MGLGRGGPCELPWEITTGMGRGAWGGPEGTGRDTYPFPPPNAGLSTLLTPPGPYRRVLRIMSSSVMP